ncbi:extracellular solute-binding protein [Flaviflagellibacter deserti]|uniref:Extracellular solute-binding protein n=1 Tax=Flaviflagellibacter deserti TaxID=2267266 RepID=A0ABV9Z077_9HYPH
MNTLVRRDVLKGGTLLAGTAAMGRFGFPMPAIAQETTTLALYSGQHAPPTDAIADAFTEATGIEIVIRRGSSAQLANQIMEEGARSPADLFYSEESPPAVALAEKGLLAPISPDTLKEIPPAYVAKDGTWLAPTARARASPSTKQ